MCKLLINIVRLLNKNIQIDKITVLTTTYRAPQVAVIICSGILNVYIKCETQAKIKAMTDYNTTVSVQRGTVMVKTPITCDSYNDDYNEFIYHLLYR
jgi:hypothetical protein